MSDNYSGILDQEPAIIESMSSSAFAPMVLPVVFILVPIIVSVVTGVILNVEFPAVQPGVYGWINLLIWWPLEIYYVVRKWKESLKNPWLTLRYWVGKRHFENDFQIIDWALMGKADPETGVAAVDPKFKVGDVAKPKHEAAGDLIYEFRLRNKAFPKLIVALKDVPERMLSFVGNVGLVQNGGLLFESRNMAAASFVRIDFKTTDVNPFIPVGVFNDCAQVAEDIKEERKVALPLAATIENAPIVHDSHRAELYYRKWQDAEALISNVQKQLKDFDRKVEERASAKVRDLRKAGQVPMGPIGAGSRGLPGSKNQWIFAGVLIFVIVIVWWRLTAH
jgi:hypothetical protein